ncbi:MAG: hypothetical protein AMXMBFR84_31610 [Candidatus Hydrogenedentota bacterium]
MTQNPVAPRWTRQLSEWGVLTYERRSAQGPVCRACRSDVSGNSDPIALRRGFCLGIGGAGRFEAVNCVVEGGIDITQEDRPTATLLSKDRAAARHI